MNTHGIEYYNDHPDELPNDPAVLEKLMEEAGDMSSDEPKSDSNPDPKPEVDDKDDKDNEQKPDGVMARDGKHVIPFSELEKARSKASELEAERDRQREIIKTLQEQQLQKDEPEPEPDEPESKDDEDSLDLETLRDEYGKNDPVVKMAEEQSKQQKTLEDIAKENKLLREQLAKNEEAEEAALADAEQKKVEAAIDANASLSQWREGNPEKFKAAAAIDDMLRNDPEWMGKPYEDRFNEVVRLLGGEVKVDKPLPSGDPKINSLSDIPAGTAPHQTDIESVKAMQGSDLTQKLSAMTQEQADAYLESL